MTENSKPVAVVGFGCAEVAYLLSRFPEEQGRNIAARLGIDLASYAPEFVAAGASSLLVRQLLSVDRDELELAGASIVFSWAVSTATRWADVALVDARREVADAFIVAMGDDVTVLLQPRALQTWYLVVKDDGASIGSMLLAMFESFVTVHPEGAAYIAETSAGDEMTSLYLRRSADGWESAAHVADADFPVMRSGLPPTDVEVLLDAILTAGATR